MAIASVESVGLPVGRAWSPALAYIYTSGDWDSALLKALPFKPLYFA